MKRLRQLVEITNHNRKDFGKVIMISGDGPNRYDIIDGDKENRSQCMIGDFKSLDYILEGFELQEDTLKLAMRALQSPSIYSNEQYLESHISEHQVAYDNFMIAIPELLSLRQYFFKISDGCIRYTMPVYEFIDNIDIFKKLSEGSVVYRYHAKDGWCIQVNGRLDHSKEKLKEDTKKKFEKFLNALDTIDAYKFTSKDIDRLDKIMRKRGYSVKQLFDATI